ncbi:hypothetical protein TREES_T100010781 [Tupaia chinensis]|uniref:Uncharacterized protein n=1 Tax=Tupaia chinensis TaxID=246437 RepID=L9KK97_TUPCH|nr:hypothetical protein TREES_T100010781 [Tupaia chinensis]
MFRCRSDKREDEEDEYQLKHKCVEGLMDIENSNQVAQTTKKDAILGDALFDLLHDAVTSVQMMQLIMGKTAVAMATGMC